MKYLYLPQYETLTCRLIWDEIADNQEMLSYLPEAKEVEKLPKQYLVNLVYAVIGDDFKAWVHERIQQRNAKVTVEKDLMINFD